MGIVRETQVLVVFFIFGGVPVLRNEKGRVVLALADSYGTATNMVVE